jgi:hypothetical protein
MAKNGSAITKTSKLAGLSEPFGGWSLGFEVFLLYQSKTVPSLRQWPFFNVLSKPFS